MCVFVWCVCVYDDHHQIHICIIHVYRSIVEDILDEREMRYARAFIIERENEKKICVRFMYMYGSYSM